MRTIDADSLKNRIKAAFNDSASFDSTVFVAMMYEFIDTSPTIVAENSLLEQAKKSLCDVLKILRPNTQEFRLAYNIPLWQYLNRSCDDMAKEICYLAWRGDRSCNDNLDDSTLREIFNAMDDEDKYANIIPKGDWHD